jgi:hypothetical protein
MAVKTTRQRREPATLATLGPDDPEALLGVDIAPRTRPPSVVTVVDPGLTALQPVMAVSEIESLAAMRQATRPPPKRKNKEQRNLVENHQAHIRADPIEVSGQDPEDIHRCMLKSFGMRSSRSSSPCGRRGRAGEPTPVPSAILTGQGSAQAHFANFPPRRLHRRSCFLLWLLGGMRPQRARFEPSQ